MIRPDILRDLKSWRFISRFLREGFAAIGLCAAIGGLLDIFFKDLFQGHGGLWASGVIIVAVAWGALRSWPRPIAHQFSSPKTRISVVTGNILDDDECHLVVGVCDTFDTASPMIDKNSLQGQLLRRYYDDDSQALDAEITRALVNASPIGTIEKTGNTSKYEIGTVATVRNRSRQLFLLAYTEMNEDNEARGSVDGIWKSLSALWTEASKRANGGTIAMPVIGGGRSRVSQILPAQDAIRVQLLSFMFAARRESALDELRIVVDPATYAGLDRLELQAFIESLETT